MGGLGYTFASSSERENTGSAGGYSQPSKVAAQEDDDDDGEGEEDDNTHQHGSSPSPKHMASESNERARHPPPTPLSAPPSDAQYPSEPRSASRGDFHSRNSGEATRSGFRVTCDTSALLVEGKEVKREEEEQAAFVKIEDGDKAVRCVSGNALMVLRFADAIILSETTAISEEVQPAVAVQHKDKVASAPLARQVPHRTGSTAQLGKSHLFKAQEAIPKRPRSSLGFTEPSRRATGSRRGILDEMCARRELPFKMIDEADGRYEQHRKITGAIVSSSSPGGRNPSSDSDPFGGSTVVIPAQRLSVSKQQSRVKRPSSASGLVIRRPARLPSRSPDIFDRMSSDPPSGGLEASSGDEDEVVPLRIRRARTEEIGGLGGDLSDTDVEDDDRVTYGASRLPSSTTSDDFAPPSSTSTSRSMVVLATPVNKDIDSAAVAAMTGHDQSSTHGGRQLRFVASDAHSGTGKKRKLELTEEDDKENGAAIMTPAGASLKSRNEARPSLGRIASLDYYAGSPAKRSCSLGAEARRLSQVVSKYQQKAPLGEMQAQPAARPRHALGELKANRKLNGTSSAIQLGKTSRLASGSKGPSDKALSGAGVMRSVSVGNFEASGRSAESTTRGRTEDEECARLLLGLGSSR